MALSDETKKTADGWFPQIIFDPQEPGPRNKSAETDVVPTPYYTKTTMPKFRKNPATADTEKGDY